MSPGDPHAERDSGGAEEPATAGRVRAAPVVWKRTWVGDRPAFYGLAGEGMPVVLLHGWALGHHTYRAVIQRIAAQGCLVYAPALPGFAGTPELPAKEFTLGGYARFLDGFLRAVGVEEKVVVVGHSFGGGVAVRFAHDNPERVRSLVLVNSIGGSAWKRGRTLTSIAERPLWDWGLHFPGDIFPIRQATRVIPVILEDALPNLVRNPRSIVRVANLARRADLRAELEELKRRGVPVTVIWGNRDGIIPRESFEAMCVAVGAEGRVIDGAHSWLLADPDAFGEVITNDLNVARLARDLEASPPPRRGPFAKRRRARKLASLTGEDSGDGPEAAGDAAP
jgi:pimeloyl-ACP methyl ester carboxylesterase